jgi:hypothetical protein
MLWSLERERRGGVFVRELKEGKGIYRVFL